MTIPVSSAQDLYNLFESTATEIAPDLTDWLEGSSNDTFGGTFSLGADELTRLIINKFNTCFFNLAQGPDENNGGPDDLQTLAVDRYGSTFARPGAQKAIDTAIFQRANNSAGSVLIPAGTIIKTQPDANGNQSRYSTDSAVTMTNNSSSTDTEVRVNITAVIGGAAGSAGAGTIDIIESTLLDNSINVSNVGNDTGVDALDSPTYRTLIQNMVLALAGATATAIEAKAETVTGVVTATNVDQSMTVIQYDPIAKATVGNFFYLPVPTLYVADATGTASPALVAAVILAIKSVRAAGVIINVVAGSANTVNWTASIVLNSAGPNYSVLVSNPQQIIDSMTAYINNLPVGTGFVRATANAAILAIWGASGTNDLVSISTSVPSGDVSVAANVKCVAGTVGLD